MIKRQRNKMANHEIKEYADALDVYMALSRTKDGQKAQCMRVVAKNPERDLALLEMKAKLAGGKWRIHKTVNKRDTEKARKWLLKKLIDFPEGRGFVDSLWRTALLQPECVYGEKKFLLDIDTKNSDQLNSLRTKINTIASNMGYNQPIILEEVETEGGWHFITASFDTREVCSLPYVELIRDGYVYVKTIEGDEK
jgi:hypothetical protein